MSDLKRITRKYTLLGLIAVCFIGYIVYAFATTSQAPQDIEETNSVHFNRDVERATLPVMVDLWSRYCAPCIELDPTVQALAKKYNGKLKIYRVVTDSNPDMVPRFNVTALPTLLFFKNGKVVARILGKHPQATIEKTIEGVLN